MTHIGAYEPTVMYFGLTNSPTTFQTMMNDLFWDLINQGDTATFIDNILVATDTEEGHDELVDEVLKRLEENDLFVNLEKCKWKVREVEFLGVVIGPKGVEMQKEKVKGVLNWPTLRNVKEVQKFYHKWPLTDLWLMVWIFEKLKKEKLDKQQMMLLSLRSNPQTMSP